MSSAIATVNDYVGYKDSDHLMHALQNKDAGLFGVMPEYADVYSMMLEKTQIEKLKTGLTMTYGVYYLSWH